MLKPLFLTVVMESVLSSLIPRILWAAQEKPTDIAEEFYRMLQAKNYSAASELLSSADRNNFSALKNKARVAGKSVPDLEKVLADTFFLMYGQENKQSLKKGKDGETIMPQRVGFFVPGQHYIEGRYAVVFTRETYEIAHADTGPVREDPRKLWVDPTNTLSQVRDEPYYKQWWVWEEDRLTMPGLLWMVKEKNKWRIDFFSGTVPRKTFTKILHWHFGRDVFEENKEKPPSQKPLPIAPKK